MGVGGPGTCTAAGFHSLTQIFSRSFKHFAKTMSTATSPSVDVGEDINSPTDSVIGRDFQELSAEEQERQREEWKAELKKTEEEILTLKQVLTAKERHAAGLKRRLGITAWREFSEDMTQGLKNLQESATYKRTAENIQFAKEIAKEKTSGMMAGITASGYFQSITSAIGAAKTKISASMSQQNFNDVLKESNGQSTVPSSDAEK